MDVAEAAQLANIGLSPEETALFRRQISLILSYVDKLREVDTAAVEPTLHGQPAASVFREDVPAAGLDAAAVLANAPARIGGEVLVPRMVEE